MKIIYWVTGILLGALILLAIMQTVASERVEVVELHTTDAAGETTTTRLWIVDDEGFQYLRGDSASGWVGRIGNNDTFEMTRGGKTARFSYELRADKATRINDLMRAKYTWGDDFFAAVMGGREDSLPIELHPLDEQ
jgi:hypothetical protein